MEQSLRLVIVGHVDHGKSTLIGRLLYDTNSLPEDKVNEIIQVSEKMGIDPEFAFVMDYLQEERERGITIDTAKVFFSYENKDYVILDAPGHLEFIKNMLTGASNADAAILMVDVDEGVMSQTFIHLYLLSLLGIKQIVVVLNKIDKVDYNLDKISKIKNAIEEYFKKIEVESKYFIPVSAKKGDNIVFRSKNIEYDGPTVVEALAEFEVISRANKNKSLFSVQDVYEKWIDNDDIIAGKVESGKFKVGDEVLVLPQNEIAKILSIKSFYENKNKINECTEGESSGLVVSTKVKRGNIISGLKNIPLVTNNFLASIFILSDIDMSKEYLIRCGTQEIICKIEKINEIVDALTLEKDSTDSGNILKVNSIANVMIKTKSPIVIDKDVEELKRFILVHGDVVAGGVILDDK
jgi:small GTP-binding protein